MQEIAPNWHEIAPTLIGLFIFGFAFAVLIRWGSKKKVEGQTAWAVAIGVFVTVLALIPILGLNDIVIILSGFIASGVPMIFEYLDRVTKQQHADKAQADEIAKRLLEK